MLLKKVFQSFLLLVFCNLIFFQNRARSGEPFFPEVQGAYGTALGRAAIALAGGPHAFFLNPAGIGRAAVPLVQLNFGAAASPRPDGLQGTMVYPLDDGTVLGLAQVFHREESLGRVSRFVGALSLPLSEARDLRLGFAVKYFSVDQKADPQDLGRGLGVDVGMLYDYRWPGSESVLSFALVARDLNTRIRWRNNGEALLSRFFTFGAAYQPNALWRGEVDLEIFDRVASPQAGRNRLRLGLERFFAERVWSGRIGYDDLLGGEGAFSAGFGYHPAGAFEVLYAFRLEEASLKITHLLSLAYRWNRWFAPGEGSEEHALEEVLLSPGDQGEPRRESLLAKIPKSGRPVSDPLLQRLSWRLNTSVISPDGDGVQDGVEIRLEEESARLKNALWSLEVFDEKKRLVRAQEGTGPPPPLLYWDGRSEEGEFAADGAYQLVLSTYGKGGRELSRDVLDLQVSREKKEIALRALSPVFSPNGDGRMEESVFNIQGKGLKQVGSWELEISEASSNRVIYTKKGVRKLPDRLSWDGRDMKGKTAADGTYLCLLVVEDLGGNRLHSDAVRVRLDATAPEATLDLDAEKVPAERSVTWSINAADRSRLSTWRLVILDEEGREFRVFQGEGDPPQHLTWDLKDAKGEKAAPGSFFTAKLWVKDEAQNEGESKLKPLQVDFTPPKDAAAMALDLTTVFFAAGETKIPEDQEKDLRDAAKTIAPYAKSSTIVVTGYAAPGEADALWIARRRAEHVRDLLSRWLGVRKEAVVALAQLPSAEKEAAPFAPEKQSRAVVTLYTQAKKANEGP